MGQLLSVSKHPGLWALDWINLYWCSLIFGSVKMLRKQGGRNMGSRQHLLSASSCSQQSLRLKSGDLSMTVSNLSHEKGEAAAA